MNASRNFGTALLLGLVGALVGIALLVIFIFPSGSRNADSAGEEPQSAQAQAPQTQEDSAQDDQKQDNTTNNDQAQNDQNQEVSRERAGEIAVEHLGGGEVTWTGREDDHGALWEIEVTGNDGAESDVFVAADGAVTHVGGEGQDSDAGSESAGDEQPQQQQPAPESAPEPAPEPQPQNVTAQQAGEIAASHVGGTVDGIYQESGDYGAAWDVDVYSSEGEYTVYVSAAGEVVHVEGPFAE